MGKMPALGLAGLFLASGLLSGCWNRDSACDSNGCRGTPATGQTGDATATRPYSPGTTFNGRSPLTGTTASVFGQGNSGAQAIGNQIPAATGPVQNSAWGNTPGTGGMPASQGSLTQGALSPQQLASFPSYVPPVRQPVASDDSGGWPAGGGSAAPGMVRPTSGVVPVSPLPAVDPGAPQPPALPPQAMGAGGAPMTPGGGSVMPVSARYSPLSPAGTPAVPQPPPSLQAGQNNEQ